MRAMTSSPGTQSIDRAAQLLVHVVENSEPTSVGSLAQTTGLPKSTTSRLVRALERQGLVQRDGARGSLSPGPVLLRFARRDAELDLPALAHDTLRRLAAETGETINLAVAGPFGVEQIAQEDSRHFLGGTNWVGRRVPFHASANGKALLAFGAARVDEGDLERLTPHTIVDRRHARDRVEDVARPRLRDRSRRARARALRRRFARLRPRRLGGRCAQHLRPDHPHAFCAPGGAWRAARSPRRRAVGAARPPRTEARCRMTHEEILRGPLRRHARRERPFRQGADRARASRRAWTPR